MQVRIVTESRLGLDLLGKKITHNECGEGIVVGYSSVSGQPFVFFYDGSLFGDRVACVDNQDIISVR